MTLYGRLLEHYLNHFEEPCFWCWLAGRLSAGAGHIKRLLVGPFRLVFLILVWLALLDAVSLIVLGLWR